MVMEEFIINEPGYFWWSEEALEKNELIPESSLAGNFKLDANGLAKLELHGMLSGGRSFFDRQDGSLSGKSIRGILKESKRHVLLMELYPNGSSFSNIGISHEGYQALKTLVSQKAFPGTLPLGCYEVSFDLSGYDDWVLKNSLTTKRKKKRLTVSYAAPKNRSYKVGEGSLIKISHDLLAPFDGDRRRHVELTEVTTLSYSRRKPFPLKEATTIYNRFQDLLFLLTGASKNLDWPRLKLGSPRHFCTYYFFRQEFKQSEVKWHECWLRLIDVEDDFGEIFSTWQAKHEEIGPGFYLFIGTARAQKNYLENKYVSLIWGLESLHRKTKIEASENEALKEKIKRILDSIPKAKDKSWLSKKLAHANEPSLQQRLSDIFSVLPFNFPQKELAEFCKSCADRRNDISHFGGQRHSQSYQGFVDEIKIKSDALMLLYHACILLEIGIDREVLRSIFKSSPSSFYKNETLKRAGLTVT